MIFDEKELDKLANLINSLRLAQRAELFKDGSDINVIEELYIDPLPNDAVFKQVIQDDTVFLIGRKGTGKSTVFARAQEYLRNQNKEISAYIDVKSLYGKSLAQEIPGINVTAQKLLLFQNFITTILTELINELSNNIEKKNILMKLLTIDKYENAQKQLNSLKDFIKEPDFIDASLIIDESNSNKNFKQTETINGIGLKANLINPELSFTFENSDKSLQGEETIKNFSSLLLRHFSIKEYMEKISSILKEIGIIKVHIFLDDFSEIDFETQQVFVNTIFSPLNNWSDKFFRFKVGAYPKRIFYGDIEKGKVTEIQLDYYDLYKVKGLPELEEKAIDFLERLLTRRFEHYLKKRPEFIFQIDNANSWDSFKKQLFYCSMNIPRILGHILFYCYHSALVYQKKITKSLIEEAAQKYYEKQIVYYFEKTNYLKEAYGETMDRFNQQLLLQKLVDTAKDLKSKLTNEDTELFKDLPKSSIPTSHFYIDKRNEKFLYSLELNYFLSKYYEQADRDGSMISIYAINYGLCKANNIIFGRPEGDTKYRKYYISRHFGFDELISDFLNNQKEYQCSKCNTKYSFKEYDLLEKINMLCFKGCKEIGYIEEKFLYADILKQNKIEETFRLSEIDLDLMHVIIDNDTIDMYASLIALELDCSYQLVSQRATKLQEKGLIDKFPKMINENYRKIYKLTPKSTDTYFKNKKLR